MEKLNRAIDLQSWGGSGGAIDNFWLEAENKGIEK